MFGDILLGIILLLGALWGWNHGMVKLLGGFGGLVLAGIVARNLSNLFVPLLLGHLTLPETSTPTSAVGKALLETLFYSSSWLGYLVELVCFLLFFAAVYLILRAIVALVNKIVDWTPLSGLNALLGAIIGVFVFALLLALVQCWLLPVFGTGATSGFWHWLNRIFTSSNYIAPLLQELGIWCLAITGKPLPELEGVLSRV